MNARRKINPSWAVIASLFCAVLVDLIPFSGWLKDAVPNMVLLTLVYWAIFRADLLGLGGAWLTGLVQDLISSAVLGQHALIYVMVVFIIKSESSRIKNLPFWEFVPWVVGFILFEILLFSIVNWLMYGVVFNWKMLYAMIGGVFIWPWLFMVLGYTQYVISNQ